jgi:hypothetical protein
MKKLLLTLLLVCSTAYAERWVAVSPSWHININYTVDARNSNIRIYTTKNLEYHSVSVVAIDCKLKLFAVYESYYLDTSKNKWWAVPKETLGTWHPTSTDQIYNLICR